MTDDRSDTPPRPAGARMWVVAIVLGALAPISGWLAWEVASEVHVQQERSYRELRRAASEFAVSVNRELSSSMDALTVLSQSELFQQGRITAMGRLLQGRPRRDWDSIFLLDVQGNVVLDTAPRPPPPQALRELHAAALKTLTPVVSGAGQPPGIAIAMPVTQGDHVRYVLGVRLNDAVWPRLAANASLPAQARARLYDRQGHLISQSDGSGGGTLGASVLQPMQRAPAGLQRAPDGDRDAYTAWDVVPVAGWFARISMPAAPIDATTRELVFHGLSTSGAALLAGLVLAAALARVFVRRAGL